MSVLRPLIYVIVNILLRQLITIYCVLYMHLEVTYLIPYVIENKTKIIILFLQRMLCVSEYDARHSFALTLALLIFAKSTVNFDQHFLISLKIILIFFTDFRL